MALEHPFSNLLSKLHMLIHIFLFYEAQTYIYISYPQI